MDTPIKEQLSARSFLRIYRSYFINPLHNDEVAEGRVIIAQKAMPISAGLKEQLLQ